MSRLKPSKFPGVFYNEQGWPVWEDGSQVFMRVAIEPRSDTKAEQALLDLPPANHDEGPPLWTGMVTATVPTGAGATDGRSNDEPKVSAERAPLITWDNTRGKYGVKRDNVMFFDGWISGAADYREAVDAKITSGELRVVKKVDNERNDFSFECSVCRFVVADSTCTLPGKVGLSGTEAFNFCPGCGALIVKA